MSTAFEQLDEWMSYSRASWQAAGSPAALDPFLILTNPIAHNAESYRWLVGRYRQIFLSLYRTIAPAGTLLSQQPPYFVKKWEIFYEPLTIWKQVCPLFVFAQALGALEPRHIQLAQAYVLGYGIPVMAVDRMMDSLPGTIHTRDTWLFVLTSYALGIELIQSIEVPKAILDCFIGYTQQMYHYFWKEEQGRYCLPDEVSADVLIEYLNGNSRLLSSIFLPTMIEWAFILAQGHAPPEFKSALSSLRKLRQLNDELVDADEDIHYGIVTYPYLHGLASLHAEELRQNIRATWELERTQPGSPNMKVLNQQRRQLLQQAGSFAATAQASLSFLRTAMRAVMTYVPVLKAFDVTLLINQRLSHLYRLAQNNWQEIPDIYQPAPFVATARDDEVAPLAIS